MKQSDPGGTDHLALHWKERVAEVMSETDPQRLSQRVAAAEAAIFQRLQILAADSGGMPTELHELRDASDRLLALKTEVLNFPDWRQE